MYPEAKIGVDIDGVLANWYAAVHEHAIEHYGRGILRELQLLELDPGNVPPGLVDALDAYAADMGIYARLEQIPGAQIACECLVNYAREFYYVTKRPKAAKGVTYRWLQEHKFPTANVVLSPKAKWRIALRLGLTHFIDDNFNTVRGMRQHGVIAYRFSPLFGYVGQPGQFQTWPQLLNQIIVDFEAAWPTSAESSHIGKE